MVDEPLASRVVDVDGTEVLRYTAAMQERPVAENCVALAEPSAVVSAVLEQLAGYWFTSEDDELLDALLAAGATAVVLLAIGGTRISAWLETRDDVNEIATLNVLYPSYLRVAPADSPQQFIEDARALEKPLTKERDAAP